MLSDPSLRDPTRKFDQTQCRAGTYKNIVHRDYLAHCLRWGWATGYISGKHDKEILDVGCGQDLPLIKIMRNNLWPKRYVGVDYNKIKCEAQPAWATLYSEFDFTTNYEKIDGPFDVVTCFEVIEHMRPKDGARLLSGLRYHLRPDAVALLSTPVFNGRAAANHLHEYTILELQAAIEAAGLEVVKRYGTFASVQDLRRVMTPEHAAVDAQVREFYGNEVASCFLAPLYPDASRNNAWLLRRAQ